MDTKPAQSPVAAEAVELVEEMAAPAADVVVPQAEVPAAETEATPAN